MKALIFNSGLGSRIGSLTENIPKCLLKLRSGESIFARQLRILSECGITDAVVTTGKYEAKLIAEAKRQSGISVQFVNNPLYASTNYIYSLYLAGEYLDDSVLMLHGDLVFDRSLVQAMLADERPDLCLINRQIPKPQKDFKGRIEDGRLLEVSVHIFDAQCCALQPMYKLSRNTMTKWLARTEQMIHSGFTGVYAEDALNCIADSLHIEAMSYAPYYINEIDTPQDYVRVCAEIERYENGVRYSVSSLQAFLAEYHAKCPFFIMGRHLFESDTDRFLDTLGIPVGRYFDVKENPSDESAADALRAFLEYQGDLIVSIGGGSAIDTAKAVKFSLLDSSEYGNLVHIAIPTTAGSGSEATQFAVIYRNGTKCSLEHPSLLPQRCILDSSLLYSMTAQQRKVSLLDAFCHSIESLLSHHASAESREHAASALDSLLAYYLPFVNGEASVCDAVFAAANDAGRAINLAKTSFAHAMSYVLTSEHGIKHGQAAAICLIYGLRYAEQKGFHPKALYELRQVLGCRGEETASEKFAAIYRSMQPEEYICLRSADPTELASKVNVQRISNSVIAFSETDLLNIYTKIVKAYS